MTFNKNLGMLAVTLTIWFQSVAQEQQIETIFNGNTGRSGGYGAISNKFTTINGEFANMVEVYGGWYIDQKLMIGAGFAGTTNYIPVAPEHSLSPGLRMSYEYGQVGMVTEYVLSSNKAVHVMFHLLTGAGFTLQYHRPEWDQYYGDYDPFETAHDTQWFFVAEPGIAVEINLLRWMRFSPGISYRFTEGSDGIGLSDADLRGASVNLALKFGKF